MSPLMREMHIYSTAINRKIDREDHEMEYCIFCQVLAAYDYIWVHQKQFENIVLWASQHSTT